MEDNTKVNVKIEVIKIQEKKVEMKMEVLGEEGKVIVDGKAVVLYEKLE